MYASQLIADELSSVFQVNLREDQDLDVIETRQLNGSWPRATLCVSLGEARYYFGRMQGRAYECFSLARKTTLSDPDCVRKIKENVCLYFAFAMNWVRGL